MIKLVNSVEILVVETTGTMEERAKYVAEKFAKEFGGFNMYEGQGGWISDDGELISEKHIKVQASFGEKGFNEYYDNVSKALDLIIPLMNVVFAASKNQDAVSLKLNDDLYIIDTYGGSENPKHVGKIEEDIKKAVEASLK